MSTLDQARATQIANIEAKTGRSLADLRVALAASGTAKHAEARAWLMETYGLSYGDANGLVHYARGSDGQTAAADKSDDDVLDEMYTGKKAHLRAVHDAVMKAVGAMGAFEVVPKKGYVALRRKKQFAMLGPKTNERAELGINLKEDAACARAVAQKPGGMCQFAVALTAPEQVDVEIAALLRRAYDAAG